MATLAMLNVLIGSDVSGLTKGLKTADKKTRSFSKRGSAAMRGFGNSTAMTISRVVNLKSAIAVLAGSAGIGLLVARQLQSIDSTAKFADMIGESTKELVGLQHAAEVTAGVTNTQFNMALQRMTRRMAEAANGTGEAKDAIKQLGLDAAELSRMGPAAAFQQISAAMQQVDNQGQRVRIAFKLFDSEGAKLVNTLNAGPEAIRQLVSEADRLGKSFDRVDAAKVEAANDAITRAQGAFSGVARTLTVELAPYIEAVANEFVRASTEANGFKDVVIGAVEGTARAVGFLGDMFRGINVVIKTLEVGFAMFAEGMYQSVYQIVDALREIANVVPGIDIGPLEGLKNVAEASTIRTNELKKELGDLVDKPMPSDNIDAFFSRVKESAQEAAVQVAESRNNMAGTIMDPDGQPINEEDQDKLETIRQSFLSEMELEQEQFEEKREWLQNANAALFDDEKQRRQMIEQLESQHQDKIKQIKYKGLDDQQKIVAAYKEGEYNVVAKTGQKMVGAIFGQNSKILDITKKAGLAMTVISGFKSAAQSLANNGGFPFGVPAMLASLAKTGAMESAISAVSMGSGGASAAVGGAAPSPTAPVTPAASSSIQGQPQQKDQKPNVTIYLPPDEEVLSAKWMRDKFAPAFNEAVGDGVEVNVA